jgi:hypothetical protein
MGYIGRIGTDDNFIKVLVGKPEGKWRREERGNGWEDNIKIYFKEIGCEVMEWIQLDPVAGSCQHRNKTFQFHKRRGIPWPAERLLASQEGHCYHKYKLLYFTSPILTGD